MFAVELISLNIVTKYKTSQGHSSNLRSWCAQPGQLENLLKAGLFTILLCWWLLDDEDHWNQFHKQEPVSKYKTFPSLWNHILTCSRYLDSRNFNEATHYRSFMAFITFPLVHMDTIVCPRRIRLLTEWLSVQFSRSVISDSLWLHGLLYARLPCPSPTAGVYSNSCS